MVKWLGKKGNDLFTPLLPHGSDDDPKTANADNTATSNLRPISPEPQPEITAAAHAVANAATRRSSDLGDAKKRRHKLKKIKSHASSISRRVSNVSRQVSNDASAASEITHRTSHVTSYDRTDSEVTDYGVPYEHQTTATAVSEDIPREKMTPSAVFKVAVVLLVTTLGIGSYAAAIVASVSLAASSDAIIVTSVAAGVCLCTVPLVWVSEYRLSYMPTLRKRVNDLRQLAERFQRELDILVEEEYYLKEEVEFLGENQEQLERIVKEKNMGNVDELVSIVHENQIILQQMKENLRQVVLQDVVKLVLQADLDRDGVINRKEATILAQRLTISLEIYGIIFDEKKFRRAVGLSPSLCGVLTIVRRLLPDENDRYSSFYSMDSDDSLSGDETTDDIYDMFYVPVEKQFSLGCAESIHLCREYQAMKGERPKLMSISPSLRKSVKGLRCSFCSVDDE